MNRPDQHLAVGVLCVALAACGDSDPLAFTVAGVDYTESELLGLTDSRRALLAELTAFGAVLADDRVEDLVEPWVDSARVAWMWDQVQAERRVDSAAVSEAVLRTRYATSPQFELTVRHLIVFSERYEPANVRAEAQAKARAALERIEAGEPFPDVAADVSDEPGAESREGLLNPGRQGAWVPEFWAAASSLEVGEVSGVTETQYGYHVLRLEARDTVPFAEARPDVVREVARLMGPLDTPMPPADEVRAAAAAAGLEPPAARFDRLREQWVVDVLGQAEQLGLPPAPQRSRVKELARDALSRTGQNAGLARQAVASWHDELDRIHPLPDTRRETSTAPGP
jgi:hypothetical protein